MGNIDFVCIGAPKSGTSSLFYWLDSHPAVQASEPKETFFFMDPDHPLSGQHGASYSQSGIEGYSRFFPESIDERLRFEGTTHYFYQSTARNYFCSLESQPRIIMSLREPASRVLSSFRFTRNNLSNCDLGLTFNKYVDCLLFNDLEKLDKYYRSASSLYLAKRELEFGRYVDWLDWWLERLSPDRLHIILFEELKHNPVGVMVDLCEFLNIDPGFYEEYVFEGKNRTYSVTHQRLHRWAKWLGGRVPSGRLKGLVKERYLHWQEDRALADTGYQEGLTALRDYFSPYNRRLNARFGLPLARWWGERASGDCKAAAELVRAR